MTQRRVSVFLDLLTSAFNRSAAETAAVLRGTKAEIKEFGDVNISTLLSLFMLVGLVLVARL